MIKACIFDLDGTLLDTLSTITYFVNRSLLRSGLAPIGKEECKSIVGDGARVLLRRAYALRGVTDADAVEEYLKEYLADYDSDPHRLTTPYDGIAEAVGRLMDAGIKVAVLSNKQDSATLSAVRHFFGDAFTLVRGGRDGVPLKPAPDAAYAMLNALGVSAEEAAYVGDSEVDVKTAAAFGAGLPVAVLWGFRTERQLREAGAKIFVRHPSELVDLILTENSRK